MMILIELYESFKHLEGKKVIGVNKDYTFGAEAIFITTEDKKNLVLKSEVDHMDDTRISVVNNVGGAMSIVKDSLKLQRALKELNAFDFESFTAALEEKRKQEAKLQKRQLEIREKKEYERLKAKFEPEEGGSK